MTPLKANTINIMNLCMFFILCVVQRSFAVKYHLTEEEHERMPPIFSVDPFFKCLRRPGGRYCTARASYVTDDDSPLLALMKEYSDHSSSRFNHTRALFGTCLTHKRFRDIQENTLDPRSFLEKCLNRTVWEEYKLKVKVDEEVHCHEHGEKRPDIGSGEIAVAVTILLLAMCNLVGSLFDIFDLKQDGLVNNLLQCFSIPRNWKALTAPVEYSDPRLERLKGINGTRAMSMTGVIVSHGVMSSLVVAENTKFVEDLYDIVSSHMLLNGTVIMQTFLFVSGFLLVYTSQLFAETNQVSWRMLPLRILRRWLRLTPPYAIVLAVTATWLPRLNTGPIWDVLVETPNESCRHLWWQNLFYVNNYCEPLCMMHTWYLATDFQLHCLGLVIFMFCRSVRARVTVLSALFAAGLLAPALHTYYQDLDAHLLSTPAVGEYQFTHNRTFNIVYKRAHTNVPSFVLGLAAGYFVYSLQRRNFDLTNYKAWRPLYWLLLPLGAAIPLSCKVFYRSPRVGLLARAAAAALLRPLFGLVIALIIVGMIFKMDKLFRGVLEWRGWVCLGRVSYSAYLLHLAYIQAATGTTNKPLYLSYLRLGEIILFTAAMVYIAACFFWLTVEAPLAQVAKICLQGRHIEEEKKNGQNAPEKLVQNKKKK